MTARQFMRPKRCRRRESTTFFQRLYWLGYVDGEENSTYNNRFRITVFLTWFRITVFWIDSESLCFWIDLESLCFWIDSESLCFYSIQNHCVFDSIQNHSVFDSIQNHCVFDSIQNHYFFYSIIFFLNVCVFSAILSSCLEWRPRYSKFWPAIHRWKSRRFVPTLIGGSTY